MPQIFLAKITRIAVVLDTLQVGVVGNLRCKFFFLYHCCCSKYCGYYY